MPAATGDGFQAMGRAASYRAEVIPVTVPPLLV